MYLSSYHQCMLEFLLYQKRMVCIKIGWRRTKKIGNPCLFIRKWWGKIKNIFFNFPTLNILVCKIKLREFQKNLSFFTQLLYITLSKYVKSVKNWAFLEKHFQMCITHKKVIYGSKSKDCFSFELLKMLAFI